MRSSLTDPSAYPYQCNTCGERYHGVSMQSVSDFSKTGECAICYDDRIHQEYLASPKYREDWLAQARVPPRYRKPYNAAEGPKPGKWEHWQGEPSTVILSGDPGLGKTYTAVEMAWRLRAHRTVFVRGTEAIRVELGEEVEGVTKQDLTKAGCLILDDLGTNTIGKAWDIVATIYARRYDACLPTIITTNLRGAKIPDPPLADRLRDALHVPMSGASKRGKKQ